MAYMIGHLSEQTLRDFLRGLIQMHMDEDHDAVRLSLEAFRDTELSPEMFENMIRTFANVGNMHIKAGE